MLSDFQIRHIAQQGAIQPFDEQNLQPSSYDLTLSDEFVVQTGGEITPEQGSYQVKKTKISTDSFYLNPGDFVLGVTRETINCGKEFAARFEGKSSLGRIGLCTHITAGFIDPGFSGQITVELSNLGKSTIILWPGMKIGQICFFKLDAEPEHVYGDAATGSHYQNQSGVTPSYIV